MGLLRRKDKESKKSKKKGLNLPDETDGTPPTLTRSQSERRPKSKNPEEEEGTFKRKWSFRGPRSKKHKEAPMKISEVELVYSTYTGANEPIEGTQARKPSSPPPPIIISEKKGPTRFFPQNNNTEVKKEDMSALTDMLNNLSSDEQRENSTSDSSPVPFQTPPATPEDDVKQNGSIVHVANKSDATRLERVNHSSNRRSDVLEDARLLNKLLEVEKESMKSDREPKSVRIAKEDELAGDSDGEKNTMKKINSSQEFKNLDEHQNIKIMASLMRRKTGDSEGEHEEIKHMTNLIRQNSDIKTAGEDTADFKMAEASTDQSISYKKQPSENDENTIIITDAQTISPTTKFGQGTDVEVHVEQDSGVSRSDLNGEKQNKLEDGSETAQRRIQTPTEDKETQVPVDTKKLIDGVDKSTQLDSDRIEVSENISEVVEMRNVESGALSYLEMLDNEEEEKEEEKGITTVVRSQKQPVYELYAGDASTVVVSAALDQIHDINDAIVAQQRQQHQPMRTESTEKLLQMQNELDEIVPIAVKLNETELQFDEETNENTKERDAALDDLAKKLENEIQITRELTEKANSEPFTERQYHSACSNINPRIKEEIKDRERRIQELLRKSIQSSEENDENAMETTALSPKKNNLSDVPKENLSSSNSFPFVSVTFTLENEGGETAIVDTCVVPKSQPKKENEILKGSLDDKMVVRDQLQDDKSTSMPTTQNLSTKSAASNENEENGIQKNVDLPDAFSVEQKVEDLGIPVIKDGVLNKIQNVGVNLSEEQEIQPKKDLDVESMQEFKEMEPSTSDAASKVSTRKRTLEMLNQYDQAVVNRREQLIRELLTKMSKCTTQPSALTIKMNDRNKLMVAVSSSFDKGVEYNGDIEDGSVSEKGKQSVEDSEDSSIIQGGKTDDIEEDVIKPLETKTSKLAFAIMTKYRSMEIDEDAENILSEDSKFDDGSQMDDQMSIQIPTAAEQKNETRIVEIEQQYVFVIKEAESVDFSWMEDEDSPNKSMEELPRIVTPQKCIMHGSLADVQYDEEEEISEDENKLTKNSFFSNQPPKEVVKHNEIIPETFTTEIQQIDLSALDVVVIGGAKNATPVQAEAVTLQECKPPIKVQGEIIESKISPTNKISEAHDVREENIPTKLEESAVSIPQTELQMLKESTKETSKKDMSSTPKLRRDIKTMKIKPMYVHKSTAAKIKSAEELQKETKLTIQTNKIHKVAVKAEIHQEADISFNDQITNLDQIPPKQNDSKRNDELPQREERQKVLEDIIGESHQQLMEVLDGVDELNNEYKTACSEINPRVRKETNEREERIQQLLKRNQPHQKCHGEEDEIMTSQAHVDHSTPTPECMEMLHESTRQHNSVSENDSEDTDYDFQQRAKSCNSYFCNPTLGTSTDNLKSDVIKVMVKGGGNAKRRMNCTIPHLSYTGSQQHIDTMVTSNEQISVPHTNTRRSLDNKKAITLEICGERILEKGDEMRYESPQRVHQIPVKLCSVKCRRPQKITIELRSAGPLVDTPSLSSSAHSINVNQTETNAADTITTKEIEIKRAYGSTSLISCDANADFDNELDFNNNEQNIPTTEL